MTTYPTEFERLTGMLHAIENELKRTDHKRPYAVTDYPYNPLAAHRRRTGQSWGEHCAGESPPHREPSS